jgi:ParB-like chromosome segregation protein Spo0J
MPTATMEPTTAAAGVFHPALDLMALKPSKTNPRKHFDAAKLAELAAQPP